MGRHIARRRLLTMVEQTPGLWVVEACAGSGKSALARQLARHYHCEISPKVPITHDRGDPDPIVVDTSESLWDPASDEAAFLLSRPDDAVTVILARRVAPPGMALASTLGARWLRARDLWFDDDELLEAATNELGDGAAARLATSLRALTDAWPVAVGACLAEAARTEDPATDFTGAARAAFGSVLDPALNTLPPELRNPLDILSAFDRFDDSMAALAGGPDVLDRLVDHSLPIQSDGRWSSLGPIAQGWVRDKVCNPTETSEELIRHLFERGHVIEAVEAAVELGQDVTAAHLLAGLGIDDAYALDGARSGAAAARLGAALDAEPRIHLVQARQQLSHGNLTGTIEALESGVSKTPDLPADHPLAEELRAELAYACYLSGDLERARSLLPEHDFVLPAARARQYHVVAGLAALTMNRDALDRAARDYRVAETLWRECGETVTAGNVLACLAMEVTSRLGRMNEAVALVERTLTTVTANPVRQTATQLMRLRLLVLAGRHGEADELLAAVEGLVGVVLRGWMAAHVHQARALMASHRGDLEQAIQHISQAQQGLGDLADHAAGAWLHIDAIDVFARCNDADRAIHHLEALRGHPGAEPADIEWAEILVACLVGDATDGIEQARRFRTGDTAVPGGEWRLDHAESIAAARLGQFELSASLESSARRGADSLGTPGIIEATRESQGVVCPQLQPATIRIDVLDRFQVSVKGHVVELPRGHGRTVLKLLALRRNQITVDEMIDWLWPDGDPELGRRRLRNVLSRIRTACGDVIERDGDLLRLTDDVSTDFDTWWNASVDALSNTKFDVCAATDLLEAAPNVLIASDRYEEWLQPLQHRYQLQLWRLLDSLASTPGVPTDKAINALRRTVEIDPWSDEVLERAMQFCHDAGRPAEGIAIQQLSASVQQA